jgi:hypothetical protein
VLAVLIVLFDDVFELVQTLFEWLQEGFGIDT